MPVPPADDPYKLIADALKEVIEEEFAAESFTAIHDKLHESLGENRVAIGISPIRKTRLPRNKAVAEHYVLVQFYGLWEKIVDPEQSVNPTKITGYANRFERAVREQQFSTPGTPQIWYFDVEDIDYPDDPTGNKTRFHATIRAHGDNNALVETRG